MMESNILANIEAIKQLQKEVLEDTKSLCMMESNTLANIAAIKLSKKTILNDTKSPKLVFPLFFGTRGVVPYEYKNIDMSGFRECKEW